MNNLNLRESLFMYSSFAHYVTLIATNRKEQLYVNFSACHNKSLGITSVAFHIHMALEFVLSL